MIRRTKVLPQNVEALRAGASESNSFDFHELRQGLRSVPHRFITEQRAIVGRLEALSAETKRLEEIYQSKVEELKKSVLQKAFSGEL